MDELNGIFIIDKPPDITSAKVINRVKHLLKVRKAGHTGTLDPFATGVMVCCVNQATKLARFFLHSRKAYQGVLELGVTTDTQDGTGNILSVTPGPWSSETAGRNHALDVQTIYSVFRQFEGTIRQVPPAYSALKHEGVPLYKLARKGKPVQKPARSVHISKIKISEIRLPEIRFEVSCSAGTYIRTLAADIGEALGYGAHLKSLRRTQSSGFTIEEAVTLSELEDLVSSQKVSDRMISMSDALRGIPAHTADQGLVKKIRYGTPISKKEIGPVRFITEQEAESVFKIVDKDNRLLAVLSDSKGKFYKYCCVLVT